MFDSLIGLIRGAWWAYPLILAMAGGDVLFPLIPSETLVITGGVVAARGGLNVVLVIAAAAVGACLGDNAAYWIGRRARGLARRWLMRGDRGRRTLEWAERTLDRHGGSVIIVGRYIPGGRTAITVSAGIAGYPWARFALFDAVGAMTWATYSTMIGFLGGSVFQQHTFLGLVLALAVSLSVAVLIEAGRWWAHRRRGGPGQQQGRPSGSGTDFGGRRGDRPETPSEERARRAATEETDQRNRARD